MRELGRKGLPALDYVSPLPPVRSGIADYSRDLLPHLEPLCDLRVVRLPGQPVAAAMEERWRPVEARRLGERGRLPLYHMGNNRHHLEVERLARETPGVLTLHDLVLHHLLIESTLAEGELAQYVERLRRDHGWLGDSAARARRWGELGQSAMFELGARGSLLAEQRGILVHSRWAADLLAEEEPDIAVRVVPMAMPLPPPIEEGWGERFRARHGLAADTPLLGSFGFQTPIKRTDRVVEALARPELDGAHLLIAGEVSPVLELEEVARRAGVADRVTVTGFLEYDEFLGAIAACDLCLNLRYPTAGETSASLLRVMAVGSPVAVSDYAQFSELPEEAALKVPLGEGEVEELARRAGALLEERDRLDEMGRAAREYVVRHHDPGAAAAAIVEACEELGVLEPPGQTKGEDPFPTTLTWRELPGELRVEGLERPWAVGERRSLEIILENRGLARWLPTRDPEGGVLVELQWRDEVWGETVEQRWAHLEDEVPPGAGRRLEVELRRPPGAGALIVEPHVKGVAGFNRLGGPRWIHDLETGRRVDV